MATVVSTPVDAFLSSAIAGTAIGQSANMSVVLSVMGYEAYPLVVGAQPNTANISAGWEFYAYRSNDGGTTFETIASVSFSVARNPNVRESRAPVLGHGVWALRLVTGGNVASTFSFAILTADTITAIQNV